MLYLRLPQFLKSSLPQGAGGVERQPSYRRKPAVNVIKESASPTEVTLNISMDSEDEEPFLSRSYRRLAT